MLSFSELCLAVWLLHTIWILVLVLHVPVLPVTLSRSVAIVPLTFFSILLLLFKRKYKFRWYQSCELQRSFVNDTAIQKLFPQCCQDQLDTSRVFCNFTAATRHVWVLLCHCHCKSDLKPCSCDCCCARPQRCSIRSASMVHAQYLSSTVFPIFRLCFTIINLSEHEIYLPSPAQIKSWILVECCGVAASIRRVNVSQALAAPIYVCIAAIGFNSSSSSSQSLSGSISQLDWSSVHETCFLIAPLSVVRTFCAHYVWSRNFAWRCIDVLYKGVRFSRMAKRRSGSWIVAVVISMWRER